MWYDGEEEEEVLSPVTPPKPATSAAASAPARGFSGTSDAPVEQPPNDPKTSSTPHSYTTTTGTTTTAPLTVFGASAPDNKDTMARTSTVQDPTSEPVSGRPLVDLRAGVGPSGRRNYLSISTATTTLPFKPKVVLPPNGGRAEVREHQPDRFEDVFQSTRTADGTIDGGEGGRRIVGAGMCGSVVLTKNRGTGVEVAVKTLDTGRASMLPFWKREVEIML